MPRPPDPTLIRGLGRWDLVAMVVHTTIGAWVAGLTPLLCAFLLSRSTGPETRDLAIAMAVGWLLLFAHRRWPRRTTDARTA